MASSFSAPLSDSIYLPYPGDCNLYYEKITLRCPSNTYWSIALQRCDNINNSNCSTPIINPPSDNRPEDNLDKLCAHHLGTFIPYPGDCSRFIQCDYIPFVKICPEYLYWNSELLTCDKICI
ncbi:hypothetical protein KR093_003047 [Drosophila rubida]|uniref:Chitin-binding type-2 domain-containing protein n=1 Tax=Drosophila rubida TaxID=30044 RepID=A0AAD4JYK9_9MUSC|nr:hypothetical protein KR093_003047 [Drosophila rubida]